MPDKVSEIFSGTVNSMTINANWSEPNEGGATQYRVTARANDKSDVTFNTTGDETSIALTGLLPGTLYTVEVVTVFHGAVSASSQAAEPTPTCKCSSCHSVV